MYRFSSNVYTDSLNSTLLIEPNRSTRNRLVSPRNTLLPSTPSPPLHCLFVSRLSSLLRYDDRNFYLCRYWIPYVRQRSSTFFVSLVKISEVFLTSDDSGTEIGSLWTSLKTSGFEILWFKHEKFGDSDLYQHLKRSMEFSQVLHSPSVFLTVNVLLTTKIYKINIKVGKWVWCDTVRKHQEY